MEVYDPAANSWTTIAPMKTAVQAAASVALNGELYVIGGMDAANATVATVQVYNPFTNKWKTGISLPFPQSSASGVVVDGLIFNVGGYGSGPTNAYVAIEPSIP
jgi:N-acetylneuraminic acid mutarotase